jgi:hypothetical protein
MEFQKAKWKTHTDTSQTLYKEPRYLDARSNLCDTILPTHPAYLVFGDIGQYSCSCELENPGRSKDDFLNVREAGGVNGETARRGIKGL